MIIGNAQIVICPFCGEKKEVLSLETGNTFGAKEWSDTKQIAPMLPMVSPVQRCTKCGKYYLFRKHKYKHGKSGSFETGDLSYVEWKQAYEQLSSDPTIAEKDWQTILLEIIHAFNDSYYRNYYCPTSIPPKEEYDFFIKIVDEFIAMSDWSKNDDMVLKAELYRETGRFQQCEDILNAIDYANGLNYYSKRIYDEVNKKMHEQDVKVFRILDDKEYYELLQKERQDTLKREHDEWIAEQSKDPRWKVCKRGHCFKNVEHHCRWCGEADIADRIEEPNTMYTKKLFVGKKDDKWILTTDANIEGQTDKIRSITIDYSGEHRFYYHIEGKNPNPFHANNIKLDDIMMIKGVDLVNSCDTLIATNAQELILTNLYKQSDLSEKKPDYAFNIYTIGGV